MMIDQQTKQEISNALKALNEQSASVRIEAVQRLGEIRVSHPQIIERLQMIMASDPSSEVRLAAQKVIDMLQSIPNDGHQNISTQLKSDELSPKTENAILEILQKQTEILDNIRILVLYSLEKQNEKAYQFRSRITDIDLSLGSMIILSIKWLVASIPVGIILGFMLIFLRACTY